MEAPPIFHHSDLHHPGVGGQKAKRGKFLKGDSVSVVVPQKKILADITNMDQPMHHPAAPVLMPTNNVSVEMILKENENLRKLLANRNAVIESFRTELQKYRKQNSELALANTQMMREINSSRQMVREFQVELASKNGVLNAMKLKLMETDHRAKLNNDIDEDEQLDQKFQEDNKGGGKRKRVPRSQSTAPAVRKQVKSTEKVDTQRYSSRRKSAALKAGKLGPTDDLFEINNDALHLPENLANKTESTSLGSKVHDVAGQDTECNSSGPTNTEQVPAKKNIENKRHSLRRQSALFRPENPEPSEDFFDVNNPKFEVSNLCDDIAESATSENNACAPGPQEIRRSSIGRPLRRSAVKIVSYKEIPLNVKMRREN
ncbi:unnamed protein product [Trifolium pratense]|uniref:Uncharacterized protein n=1 Tax=Trifolium pratense TaxID=57577 RepID=A0ACB0IBH2_TRIPR|nr:unnamed protein product [Trifolium pratense]